MATMLATSDVSRGTILELDGALQVVLESQRIMAGKGNSEARVRMKLRDVRTGFTRERVFRTDERVPKADVDSRPYQYLYNEGDLYHFMDGETFEEKIVPRELLGDAANYLVDGLTVEMLVYQDQPVSIALPTTVDLRITATDPGFKGDTAQGGSKKAVTETGLQVDVPMFLNEGDVIRVDTRSGAYVGRV